MERLTLWDDANKCWIKDHSRDTRKWKNGNRECMNRLAAYEDTGLTPEQIKAQQQEIERLNKVLDDWKYNAKCDADHIAGLLADKDE